MREQEVRGLQEAYDAVYEAKVDKKLPEHERSGARLKRYDNPSGSLALGGGQQRARRAEHEERRGVKKEEVDLFDIILSHLLDEGYAETPEAAEAIMVNMGEEWKEDIVEETKRTRYLQKKFNKENERKSGSAHTYISGKQNTGQALQKARESDRQMRGDK